MQKNMTVQQAAEKWVGEFDAIQQGMIDKLMQYEPDDWEEVTLPSYGDRVYVEELPEDYDGEEYMGEVVEDHGDGTYTVRLDDDEQTEIECERDALDVQYDGCLPMWGTMWSFGWRDKQWGESNEGMEALSRCGFRVYPSEEFGVFFGIDGAGYSFMGEVWRNGRGEICSEGHWIPLYLARGLHWHDPDTVPTKEAL